MSQSQDPVDGVHKDGSARRSVRVALLALLLMAPAHDCAAAPRLDERATLDLAEGRRLHATIRQPDAAVARGQRLPAVMLFGGFERGASALDLVQPTRPTVLASFDYPLAVPAALGWRESLALLPQARRAIHDSFEAIGLLHAQLRQRPEVDPARISIVGVSFGAPFAVVSAAEHRIPGLIVIHGFGDVTGVISHQFAWRWDVEQRPWLRPLAWLLGRFLNAYAALPRIEQHARRLDAGQHVWMLSAQDDALIPPRANESLRTAFAESAASFDYETETGGHLRGEDDPRIPELLQRTEAWLVSRGL